MTVQKLQLSPLPGVPHGIRSRLIEDVNGLDMHVLEAGYDQGPRPAVLLLHGFPELAFCWRQLMPLLADNGFHVVAPDQRGYGRTSPNPVSFEDDVEAYGIARLAADMVSLTGAMGIDRVHAVIGHDFGAIVAGMCALIRPDLFQRLVLLATPFAGAPARTARPGVAFDVDPLHASLANLRPPRKHYQRYYAQRTANEQMWHCAQGLKQFLRGYYHQKSADWPGNCPHPLASWTAGEIARMPSYYCMPADCDMAQVAAQSMPNAEQISSCAWLSDQDLDVVTSEFERTGFQGGLQWYRRHGEGGSQRDLQVLAGRKVEVPTIFICGSADWGAFQVPGALEAMRKNLATREVPVHFVEGAGHWLPQEQPQRLAQLLLPFLHD